ncbi:hypothetical protein ACHHYP_20515 [Achlya hypogyna]|uniref:Uncharacterized protein n=1 Tax=Achlya hypogyna TaxID=1202772 RepID=A0A1V9YK50_ACHHY|nr:hypothetical protein ACHHYP_20515 [Achlya hypogyna]
MQRVLKRLGYKYHKGQQRHTIAETAANVVFRARYLRAKLANRSARNEPIVPEVYLDKSFCNLHHEAPTSNSDYHGNFTAEKFERWFEHLCAILLYDYRLCIIHMDGAKYH